jgi:hypothetical protein
MTTVGATYGWSYCFTRADVSWRGKVLGTLVLFRNHAYFFPPAGQWRRFYGEMTARAWIDQAVRRAEDTIMRRLMACEGMSP